LQKNLFYDALKELTYEDVGAFLEERIAESVYLDYKCDLGDGKDIPKDVASMANAHGGLLVIGVTTVGEDVGPGRPDKRLGVEDPEKVKDAIAKKCNTVLKPVLIPEMWHYQIPGTERFLVLVRIPESLEGPHWFGSESSCTIPVRTNDFTTRYSSIKFLTPLDFDNYSQRRLALEKRQHELLDRARRRSKILGRQTTYLSVGVVPHYPDKPVCSLQKLSDEFVSISGDYLHKYAGMTSAKESMCLSTSEKNPCYMESTIWGSLYLQEPIEPVAMRSGRDYISVNVCLEIIGKMLKRAYEFYASNKFLGLVRIEIAVERDAGMTPFYVHLAKRHSNILDGKTGFSCPDDSFLFALDYFSADIIGDHIKTEIVREMLYCCGLGHIATENDLVVDLGSILHKM